MGHSHRPRGHRSDDSRDRSAPRPNQFKDQQLAKLASRELAFIFSSHPLPPTSESARLELLSLEVLDRGSTIIAVLAGTFSESDRPVLHHHAARCESLLRASLAALLNRKRTPNVVIHIMHHPTWGLEHHS